MSNSTQLCDIGLIGLGVMGKNLELNLADNGYSVAAFDLDQPKIDSIIAQDEAERGDQAPRIHGCNSFTELLSKLKRPHLIILSVPAGKAVDSVCENLIGAGLQPDDIAYIARVYNERRDISCLDCFVTLTRVIRANIHKIICHNLISAFFGSELSPELHI